MEFVAAAALVYWDELQGKTEPKMDKDLITTFCEINSLEGNEPVVEHVKQYLYEIKKNRDNICIMQILLDNMRTVSKDKKNSGKCIAVLCRPVACIGCRCADQCFRY